MHDIEVRTEIDAPAERVWEVLADFGRYGEWNPFVRSIRGELVPGRAIAVQLALGSSRPMTIKPTLLRFDAPRELRWRGRVLVPGIFDGEHSFVVEPRGPRSCVLIHAEHFSGVLIPLFRRLAGKQTEQAFTAMNLALKARAEG